MPLSACEQTVLNAVSAAGALTSRRVRSEFGPRPNWCRLITDGLLSETQTLYGAVLAATPRAHRLGRELGSPRFPYLTGPATVADRAYLNDALALLEAEGYTVERHGYKRAAGLAHQGTHTDQIVHTVLRVPKSVAGQLAHDWGWVYDFKVRWDGSYDQQLGYPRLYSSVGSGGIGLGRLKGLYRRHRLDIHVWRHPMLVVVPDRDRARAYLRRLEAERRLNAAWHPPTGPRFPYDLVRLVVLPLP
ncbi:hypothetical protein [Deinococcus alpinitundrae]|uniref:hypothetical protein n=1 Tax=Deinococcus alpinitundrae TaxID=468913 RepID=UPI00137AAC9B|nr:hypothetical protein [Deinococcus alpinitundrae]